MGHCPIKLEGEGHSTAAWDTGVNSSGTDELQFTLQDVNEPNRRRRRRFEVTMASVNVLLGERTASHSRRSAAARPSGRRRRLGISVYAVKNPDEADVEDAPPSPLAVLQLTGSRSRRRLSSWERLRLPTTYIQDALDAGDGVVRLRIVCDGCDSFGRRLVVEPGPTAAPSSTADDEAPYLEVVGNRRRRRRHRHLLCPPSTSSVAEGSRLAAVIRRRCSLSSSRG